MSAAPAAGLPVIAADRLRDLVARVLFAAGADHEAALLVGTSLVASDLRGVSSHGFMRVPQYLAAIDADRIRPAARPRVRVDDGALLALDGQGCFGQVGAAELAARVSRRARQHGLSMATLAGVAHVGRVGEWVERVADDGCLAMAWCSCGDPFGNVVPFGGRERRLGTNPIAYAVPAGTRPPVVADFSTSVVAEGKVRLLAQNGGEAPDGWLLDAAGQPTGDPGALYGGGAIQPMGGHKGYALSLLVELLGGVLAGAGCASLGDTVGNGLVLLAVDGSRLRPSGEFVHSVEAVLAALAATPPADGVDEVVIPGEPERVALRARLEGGIPIAPGTWATVAEAAASVGVELPPP